MDKAPDGIILTRWTIMPEQLPEDQQHPISDDGEALLKAHQIALENDDAEGAQESTLRLMALAVEQGQNDPSPDLLLKMEARRREEAGEWHEAEAAYRQALAVAVAEGNAFSEFKAHYDLSELQSFLGHRQQAQEEARLATDAARRSGLVPLLIMALERQARTYLIVGDPLRALEAADETLRISPEGKMGYLQRARALIMRARCKIELGELATAQADLDEAQPLLAPMSGVSIFAGVQSALAGLWEVAARLRSVQGDKAGSVEAWRECVELARLVSTLPQLGGPYKFAALARMLDLYGVSLLAVEDVDAAENAFEESRAIRRAIRQPDMEG